MSCVLSLLHFLNRPFWAHKKGCRKMFFTQGNAPHFVMAETCTVLSSACELPSSTQELPLQVSGEHWEHWETLGAIIALSACASYAEEFSSGTRQAMPK